MSYKYDYQEKFTILAREALVTADHLKSEGNVTGAEYFTNMARFHLDDIWMQGIFAWGEWNSNGIYYIKQEKAIYDLEQRDAYFKEIDSRFIDKENDDLCYCTGTKVVWDAGKIDFDLAKKGDSFAIHIEDFVAHKFIYNPEDYNSGQNHFHGAPSLAYLINQKEHLAATIIEATDGTQQLHIASLKPFAFEDIKGNFIKGGPDFSGFGGHEAFDADCCPEYFENDQEVKIAGEAHEIKIAGNADEVIDV